MAAKLSTVQGDILLRIAGETVVVGSIDIPVTVSSPEDDDRPVVTFPKSTVRHGLKQLARRIAETLA